MTWEYQYLMDKDFISKNRIEILDEWGAAGWELTSVVVIGMTTHYYFKRPRL